MAESNEAGQELLISWIWLSLACGAGSDAYDTLLPGFEYSASAVYGADREKLAEAGVGGTLLARLSDKSTAEAESIYAQCRNEGIRLLTPLHRGVSETTI